MTDFQVTKQQARMILQNAGKILMKAGKYYVDKKFVLKDVLRVAGKAFLRGGMLGAAGLDPQMADTDDLLNLKPETRDGETVMVRSVPTLEKNREQARYYYNLGSALVEFSKQRHYTDGGNGEMQLIREAFRQVAEENACEYKTMLELASRLNILRESSVEFCRNVPDKLAQIDLGIRQALNR